MKSTRGNLVPALLIAGGAALLLIYLLVSVGAGLAPVPPTRVYEAGAEFPIPAAERFGVTGAQSDYPLVRATELPFAHYSSWLLYPHPLDTDEVTYWQMIRLQGDSIVPTWHEIDAALAAHPGTYWIIGNEPDVSIQDNVLPEVYAELYHELYWYLKRRDPSAQVVIGGVSQPTPLRLAYLDRMLDHYEARYGAPMPVDIWNVHAFILNEAEDSWGIGIPPGMDDSLALEYTIEDHIDMDIFRQNIIDFRAWMAARGYGDRPLIVSEYGFLMPEDFGFTQEQIADFMRATFDFFLEARSETGLAADDNRLVQWWLWFIVAADEDEFEASFLYDRTSARLTPLGEVYADYVDALTP
jgi:hypothetical protein